MARTKEKLALAYLDAVAKKDMDRVASIVAPDVRFIGPASTTPLFCNLSHASRNAHASVVQPDVSSFG